jgi:hypothetical protein
MLTLATALFHVPQLLRIVELLGNARRCCNSGICSVQQRLQRAQKPAVVKPAALIIRLREERLLTHPHPHAKE